MRCLHFHDQLLICLPENRATRAGCPRSLWRGYKSFNVFTKAQPLLPVNASNCRGKWTPDWDIERQYPRSLDGYYRREYPKNNNPKLHFMSGLYRWFCVIAILDMIKIKRCPFELIVKSHQREMHHPWSTRGVRCDLSV
jgi:hypothetical protein